MTPETVDMPTCKACGGQITGNDQIIRGPNGWPYHAACVQTPLYPQMKIEDVIQGMKSCIHDFENLRPIDIATWAEALEQHIDDAPQ